MESNKVLVVFKTLQTDLEHSINSTMCVHETSVVFKSRIEKLDSMKQISVYPLVLSKRNLL